MLHILIKDENLYFLKTKFSFRKFNYINKTFNKSYTYTENKIKQYMLCLFLNLRDSPEYNSNLVLLH